MTQHRRVSLPLINYPGRLPWHCVKCVYYSWSLLRSIGFQNVPTREKGHTWRKWLKSAAVLDDCGGSMVVCVLERNDDGQILYLMSLASWSPGCRWWVIARRSRRRGPAPTAAAVAAAVGRPLQPARAAQLVWPYPACPRLLRQRSIRLSQRTGATLRYMPLHFLFLLSLQYLLFY